MGRVSVRYRYMFPSLAGQAGVKRQAIKLITVTLGAGAAEL